MNVNEINDSEFSESKLEKVHRESNGFGVTSDDGWLFFLPLHGDIVPAVGDTLRLYGKGFGRPVRGAAVNGEVFFYRSEAEEKARHEQWCADEKAKKLADYEAKRGDYEARVLALPAELRRRFARFEAARVDWWPEFGHYELFCCEQAVAIADAFRRGGAEALKAWARLGYEEQKEQVPALSSDHSGNTFGMSARLAFHLLTDPRNAEREHGALVQLVGCEDYGCLHPKE